MSEITPATVLCNINILDTQKFTHSSGLVDCFKVVKEKGCFDIVYIGSYGPSDALPEKQLSEVKKYIYSQIQKN